MAVNAKSYTTTTGGHLYDEHDKTDILYRTRTRPVLPVTR